jgi:hypothetical protein
MLFDSVPGHLVFSRLQALQNAIPFHFIPKFVWSVELVFTGMAAFGGPEVFSAVVCRVEDGHEQLTPERSGHGGSSRLR